MRRPTISRFLAVAVLLAAPTLSTPASADSMTGPSTTVAPYMQSHLPSVDVHSLLTVDDEMVPKTGGGTTLLVRIPDGIGVIDGADRRKVFVISDNDGVEDWSGESWFLPLGSLSRLFQ